MRRKMGHVACRLEDGLRVQMERMALYIVMARLI
jgi:hypothetical protein